MNLTKIKKYLSAATMSAVVVLVAFATPTIFIKNSNSTLNQSLSTNSTNGISDNQLANIENDIVRQNSENLVQSIDLPTNSYGGDHSAIIIQKIGSSDLWTWGKGDDGQLGNGNISSENEPKKINTNSLDSNIIKQVALGADFTILLSGSGTVYTVGLNTFGQLGIGGDTPYELSWQKIPDSSFGGEKIAKIATGRTHAAALTVGGKLYIWGNNASRQIDYSSTSQVKITAPLLIDSNPFSSPVSQISLGADFTAILTEKKEAFLWGDNTQGQIGNSSTSTPNAPFKLPLGPIKQIETGKEFAGALLENGEIYLWGANDKYQLAYQGEKSPSPRKMISTSLADSYETEKIEFGYDYCMAITTEKKCFVWGSSENGKLGNGIMSGQQNVTTPILFEKSEDTKNIELNLNSAHTMATVTGNNGSTQVYLWGGSDYGQSLSPTDVVYPTWLSKFGLDSSIKANEALMATQAVTSMWNYGFDSDGFKKAFHLTNIENVPDQKITMNTAPVADNTKQTVTMKIDIKYFYDEHGVLVDNTGPKEMVINNFRVPNVITDISPSSNPPKTLVVDQWLDAMKDENGEFDLQKTVPYLNWKNPPDNITIEINSIDIGYKTGILELEIIPSKVRLEDGVVRDNDKAFLVELSLIPRITTMTAKTSGYLTDFTATDLKTTLFNEKGEVKDIKELEKYVDIIAPSPDASYELVTDSWKPNGGDGIVDFKVKATNFYNKEGQLNGQDDELEVAIKLENLIVEESSITEKTDLTNTVRVDKFMDYVGTTGTVGSSKLGEFFNLVNVPSTATFEIIDPKIQPDYVNFIKNEITFKLTIFNANGKTPDEKVELTDTYKLVLKDQHAPTTMSVNPNYDRTVDIRTFYNLFSSDGTKVDKPDVLKQFVIMNSLPDDAEFTLVDIDTKQDQGKTKFKLASTNAYDLNSDPTVDYVSPNFLEFQLAGRLERVSVIQNPNAINTMKVDAFANQIQQLSGKRELQSFLFDNYFIMKGNLPPAAVFSVTGVSPDFITGKISFKLSVSQYYNYDGVFQNSVDDLGTFEFQLSFLESKITLVKNEDPSHRVDQFIDYLKDGGTNLSRTRLEEYFSLEYIPEDAEFSVEGEPVYGNFINSVRTTLTFKMKITKFNDNNNAVKEFITQSFAFKLGEFHQETDITRQDFYDSTLTVGEVVNNLKSLTGDELKAYLKQFVVFQSIPSDGVITVDITNEDEAGGTLTFKVLSSTKYNDQSEVVANYESPEFTFQLGETHDETVIAVNSSYTKIRIDEFVNNISTKTGQTLHDYLVNGNYMTTTSGINTEKLSVNILTQDNRTGDLKISVTIPSYYDENKKLVKEPKTFELIYQLTPIYDPTIIQVANTYPKNITVDEFKAEINKSATVSGGDLSLNADGIVFIKKFIKLESLPTDAAVTLTWNTDPSDSQVSFTLSLDKHYTADGNLGSAHTSDPLILDLVAPPASPDEEAPTYPETEITVKTNAPEIKSSDDFLALVYPGKIADFSQLSLYLDGLDSLPATFNITDMTKVSDPTPTSIEFSLTVDQHYNAEGKLDGTKTFNFILKLMPRNTPTKISIRAGGYPTDVIVDEFKTLVNAQLDANNNLTEAGITKLQLDKFLEFTSVPKDTTYTLMWNDDPLLDLHQVSFRLKVNQYYDADGFLKSTDLWFNNLVLDLSADIVITHAETKFAKKDIPILSSVDELKAKIYNADGSVIYDELLKLVDGLNTIPFSSIISVKLALKANDPSKCELIIVLDSYYNSQGILVQRENSYPFEFDVQYTPVIVDNVSDFPWYWGLVAGVGGAAVLGLATWYIIKVMNDRKTAISTLIKRAFWNK